MKKIVFVLSLLLAGTTLFAQIQQLQTANQSIEGSINVLAETADLSTPSSSSTLVTNLQAELKESELILAYNLSPLSEDQYYLISLRIQLNGSEIQANRAYFMGDWGKITEATKNEQKEIIWTDILEQFTNIEGQIRINLSVELWGSPRLPFDIDCDNPPSFTFKQQLPHFAAGVAGLGAIGAGLLLHQDADQIYDEQYLTAPTEADAEPFYQDANSKRKTALSMIYAGAGVVLVDAVWYIIRRSRYNKRKAAFDTYCTQNQITVVPVYLPPSIQREKGLAGLRLTYTFGK